MTWSMGTTLLLISSESVYMISAWYQSLHVTRAEMSIYNSEPVLLSDVVEELIQDFVLFLLLLFKKRF